VIELKRGADAGTVLQMLQKRTSLQTTFGAHLLALDKGQPRVFDLKQMLECFREHRLEVVQRRSRHELEKAEAERQLQAQRDEAKRAAARLKEQSIAEAKKESQKIIEQAHKNEKRLKEQVMRQMEEKTVEYGGRIFKLVFSDLMTGQLNRQFVNELVDALDEIEAGSIVVDSSEAVITVSHELDKDQKDRITKILRKKFNKDATVTEVVDESILGGLILKMGSLEIDGSLKNRYREAVEEVKKEADVAA